MNTQIFAAVLNGWLPENRNGVTASTTTIAIRTAESSCDRGVSHDRSRVENGVRFGLMSCGTIIGAPPETGPADARPERAPSP